MQFQCHSCTNAPQTGGSGAIYYPVTNGQVDSPRGCTWACLPPFKIYSGQCVACTLVNPIHPGVPCAHPWLAYTSSVGNGTTGVLNGVRYRIFRFTSSGYIQFSQNVTVDLLIIGGGGAGGGAYSGGAGGGGGAGQVILVYGVLARGGLNATIYVGAGGAGRAGYTGYRPESSYVTLDSKFSALYGGSGGGTQFAGTSGASTGGSGDSSYVYSHYRGYSGYYGGVDTTGMSGGGGGGSTGNGADSVSCKAGNGGTGTILFGNSTDTFFGVQNLAVAGGGGGGTGQAGCPAGAGAAGGGDGTSGASAPGLNAQPNTGSGGGGASSQGGGFVPGGNGGSGLVVVRFVDEACACA